jgi:uncharacterized Zn finger protein
MKCRRCKGLIVKEQVFTLGGRIPMLRCVYCGDLVDKVVMANRNRSEISRMERPCRSTS